MPLPRRTSSLVPVTNIVGENATVLRRSALFVVDPHSRSIVAGGHQVEAVLRRHRLGTRRGRPCRAPRRSPRRRSRTGRANSRSASCSRRGTRTAASSRDDRSGRRRTRRSFSSVPVYLGTKALDCACAPRASATATTQAQPPRSYSSIASLHQPQRKPRRLRSCSTRRILLPSSPPGSRDRSVASPVAVYYQPRAGKCRQGHASGLRLDGMGRERCAPRS